MVGWYISASFVVWISFVNKSCLKLYSVVCVLAGVGWKEVCVVCMVGGISLTHQHTLTSFIYQPSHQHYSLYLTHSPHLHITIHQHKIYFKSDLFGTSSLSIAILQMPSRMRARGVSIKWRVGQFYRLPRGCELMRTHQNSGRSVLGRFTPRWPALGRIGVYCVVMGKYGNRCTS